MHAGDDHEQECACHVSSNTGDGENACAGHDLSELCILGVGWLRVEAICNCLAYSLRFADSSAQTGRKFVSIDPLRNGSHEELSDLPSFAPALSNNALLPSDEIGHKAYIEPELERPLGNNPVVGKVCGVH